MLGWKMLTVSSRGPLLRGRQVGTLTGTPGKELKTLHSTNPLAERGSVSIFPMLDMGKLRQRAKGATRV